jgi:hypothetical protein
MMISAAYIHASPVQHVGAAGEDDDAKEVKSTPESNSTCCVILLPDDGILAICTFMTRCPVKKKKIPLSV